MPAVAATVLLLRLQSTVAEALVVLMALSAVTLMGLATGAVLGVRLAVMVRVPPDK